MHGCKNSIPNEINLGLFKCSLPPPLHYSLLPAPTFFFHPHTSTTTNNNTKWRILTLIQNIHIHRRACLLANANQKEQAVSLPLHCPLSQQTPQGIQAKTFLGALIAKKGKWVYTYEWVRLEWLINNERTHTTFSLVTSSQNMSQKGICLFQCNANSSEKSAWTKLEPPFQISANSLNFSIVQSLPWAKHGLQRASVKHINEFPWNNCNLTHYQLLT